MQQRIADTTEMDGGGIRTWHPPPPMETVSAATDTDEHVWAVILAGGCGTRLQQFIRHTTGSDRPKQFCRIVGTRSMLRHTWDRARRLVSPTRMVTVITAGQGRYLEEEERSRGVPGHAIIQPANRETGPGVLLPVLWITERDPGATVVVFPADHFIWEEERFLAYVRAAVRTSQRAQDRMVILGVEADAPEQSYGWIAPGLPFETDGGAEVYRVRSFWEKPDRSTAARLFADGYFWNTFVVAGHVTAFVRATRQSVPAVLEPLTVGAAFLGTRYQTDVLAATYRRLRSTSFSQVVLAGQPDALLTLPIRGVYWSDWGDPERILRTLRRFDRRPGWLPAYARAMARAAEVI